MVQVYGESHGPMLGVIMDGVPSGILLSSDDFAEALARRRAGAYGTTSRREPDVPLFLSGICNSRTTGAPLNIAFENSDTKSSDYAEFSHHPRPGHADYAASVKFHGYNDMRGGGHFSGRMTLALVVAGVVARKILANALQKQYPSDSFSGSSQVVARAGIIALAGHQLSCPFAQSDDHISDEVRKILEPVVKAGDSAGAVIECSVSGLPAGLGEPFFDSVESLISHLAFSIPGVRGVEFGDGFAAASMYGSKHNDPITDVAGHTLRNGAGGVNGGITNGNDIIFRVAFKPTSSIAQAQYTFDFHSGKVTELNIHGRHDVCFALRCPVIVESVAYIALAQFV